MLRKIASYIPVVQSLAYFPGKAHLQAVTKLLVLWVLTSMPVLYAVLLSPVPDGNQSTMAKFAVRLGSAFSASEQFVYAAAFLAPVLFIIYEKVTNSEELGLAKKIEDMKVFRGYWLIALVALILLFLTAASYSALKTSAAVYEETFLNHFVVRLSPWIYLYSVLCWYLTLLDSSFTGNYVQENRRSELDLQNDLSKRLSEDTEEHIDA